MINPLPERTLEDEFNDWWRDAHCAGDYAIEDDTQGRARAWDAFCFGYEQRGEDDKAPTPALAPDAEPWWVAVTIGAAIRAHTSLKPASTINDEDGTTGTFTLTNDEGTFRIRVTREI